MDKHHALAAEDFVVSVREITSTYVGAKLNEINSILMAKHRKVQTTCLAS